LLFEFFNPHSFAGQFDIKYAAISVDVVTFFSDLYHGFNNLIFDKQRMEAKVAELFREIVVRNLDQSIVRYSVWRSRFWENEICWDHVFLLVFG
jgi:hypothetical protein